MAGTQPKWANNWESYFNFPALSSLTTFGYMLIRTLTNRAHKLCSLYGDGEGVGQAEADNYLPSRDRRMSDGDRQILVGEVALITGGGGYLGRKLGNELLRQGGKVILFDISWPFDNDESYSRMTCFKVRSQPCKSSDRLKIG